METGSYVVNVTQKKVTAGWCLLDEGTGVLWKKKWKMCQSTSSALNANVLLSKVEDQEDLVADLEKGLDQDQYHHSIMCIHHQVPKVK